MTHTLALAHTPAYRLNRHQQEYNKLKIKMSRKFFHSSCGKWKNFQGFYKLGGIRIKNLCLSANRIRYKLFVCFIVHRTYFWYIIDIWFLKLPQHLHAATACGHAPRLSSVTAGACSCIVFVVATHPRVCFRDLWPSSPRATNGGARQQQATTRGREHAAQGSESAGRIAWADNIWIKMPPVSQTHALGGGGGGGEGGAGLNCHAPTIHPHVQLKWLIGWSDLKPRHDELTFVGCLRL